MLSSLSETLLVNCLFLIVGATLVVARPAAAQVVEISDPNLREVIRETLALPVGASLTQQEMLRLTRIDAPEKQIEDLTGLQHATNLEWIEVPRNNISNLTPLADLTQLERLGAWVNPISDLSPLANLTKLRGLDLAGCYISNITPLADLAQLEWLTLQWQQNHWITDITPLANLTKLRNLRLSGNRIVDINPIVHLTMLKELWIDNNRIVDISPLANLTQLTDLTLANNAITDFQPLFGLNLQNVDMDIHKLQELASIDVKIPDLNLGRSIREELGLPAETPLTQLVMSQLTRLDAPEKQIENLTGLEHATNLKWIDVHQNNISDLKPLAKLTQLERLGLWINPISDLSPLTNLIQLRGLDLSGCNISDITPLANLTQLEWLTLAWNRLIEDLTPLANLTQLTRLDLSGNRIVDISPLASLTMLKELRIDNNRIVDYSPLDGLSLSRFDHDEICELSDLPIEGRIENRNFPSIFQAWGGEIINQPILSREDRLVHHDLYWHGPGLFGLHWRETSQGYQLMGTIEQAKRRRDVLLAKNPNMLFLSEIRLRDAGYTQYPEDWPYWLRDEEGNLVGNAELTDSVFLIDFTQPGAQDIVVQQVIAVAKCGLFDGIFIDWWNEGRLTLASPDWSVHYSTPAEELEIKISLLKRIRTQVPDDFLILSNNNRSKLPFSAPYINGSFMETFRDRVNGRREYTREGITEIEDALIWLEANMREPQINCLEGWGIPTEPPDSPNNQRWMRLFTTMNLTLSDGYVLYNIGWDRSKPDPPNHRHYWHSFWDANLGQPIGPTAQRYQEDIEGLYIREFTNGWAVYNRSGQAQTISLPSSATPVSDRVNNDASLIHLLPDLDGEIYIATRSFADVNGDGKVNVLDLVQVANGFGKAAPDPNGDGVVNVLDLVFVAQQFR